MNRMNNAKNTYELLRRWNQMYVSIETVKGIARELENVNDVSQRVVGLLSPADDVVLSETLELESQTKAKRSYLISRVEDKIAELANTQKSLARKIEQSHSPLRIALDEENDYELLLRERVEKNFDYDIVRENPWASKQGLFAVELPIGLPSAYELMKMGSVYGCGWRPKWRDAIKIAGKSLFGEVDESKADDVDYLVSAFKVKHPPGVRTSAYINVGTDHTMIAAGVKSNELSLKKDYARLFAVKEGNRWTTHYVAGTKEPIIACVSALAREDFEEVSK